MARRLNGSNQHLQFSAGSALNEVHQWGMAAVLIKRGSTGGSWQCPLYSGDGGASSWGISLDIADSNVPWFGIGTGQATGSTAMNTTDRWYLLVVRKASGTVAPLCSIWNSSSGTWTHSTLSAFADGSGSPTVSQIRLGNFGGFDPFNGDIAAGAIYHGYAPSNAALEALGLHTSAQAWIDAAANATLGAGVWIPGQTAVGDQLLDLTGNGANETSSNQGSVVADPTDWYDLGGGGGEDIELGPATIAALSGVSGSLQSSDALAGSLAASSSVVGTLAASRALAGAVVSMSSLSGELRRARALSGSVSGASALTGTMRADKSLSGSVNGATSLAGTLAVVRAMAGSIAGEASLDGSLGAARPLAGAISATSSLLASVSVARALTGEIDATSSVSGSVAVARTLSGTVAGLSALTGVLEGGGILALVGTIAGTSSVAGTLSVERALSGSVSGTSTLVGSLSGGTIVELVGTVSAVSGISGALQAVRPLTGTVDALSSLAGSMAVSRGLSGSIDAVSLVAGSMAVLKPLSGLIAAQSELVGVLGTPVAVVLTDVIGPIEVWRVTFVSGETVVLAFDPFKVLPLEASNA